MTDAPTVFTKLSVYAEWIDDIIEKKPQMRNTKSTKMVSKNPRAFPIPILTTPEPLHLVTKISDHHMGTTEIIYPDEILVIREILQEIVLSNNSIIDYILYGDMLGTENEGKNILTTTEKIKDIYHHPLVNKSIFLIGRQNKQQPRIVKATELSTVNDDSSSNYDEIDTGIKILESLVGFTAFSDKSTTAKARFNVKDNKKPKQITTGSSNIIEDSEYEERPDLKDGQKNIPNDSSSYYEDESGISIEASKTTITSDSSSANNYAKKSITKSNTSLKRLKLEDYKNVIFNLNPSRESRGIITVDKKNTKQLYNSNKHKIKNYKSDIGSLDRGNKKESTIMESIKLDDHENVTFNRNPVREGRDIITVHKKQKRYMNGLQNFKNKMNINGDDEMKSESDDQLDQKMETAVNVLPEKAMPVSLEDFEYDDKRTDKQEYYNNMRSRYNDREPILWRYRSSA